MREQWGKLTDDDLDQIAGKHDQLEGKIQERCGIARGVISTIGTGHQTWH
nr:MULTISPECIES: CsbD family protein [unclassified Rhizobium]